MFGSLMPILMLLMFAPTLGLETGGLLGFVQNLLDTFLSKFLGAG